MYFFLWALFSVWRRNLLDNALRHGAGAPVELRTALVDDEVWLTVRDHGPGVASAQLVRLGEPFYRPDAARARAAGGVGLLVTDVPARVRRVLLAALRGQGR